MPRSSVSWNDIGSQVAHARRVAQLSQAELASAVRLDRTAITKIEMGERKLDSLELVSIAGILKRPIEWFLLPPLPAVVSRRTRPEARDESRSDALLESLARDVNLLIELELLVPPQLPISIVNDSVERAEMAARELRTNLGLPSGPVWDLTQVAEKVGLYGFCLNLQDDSLDGSYLRLPSGGVAVINGAAKTGRRRFTFVHELGHHIFSDDYSDEWIVGFGGDEREKLINAFAIHFLMPRESVISRWTELDGSENPRQVAIILGAEYGVSWSAAIGQLRNLNLINTAIHDQLIALRPTKFDYIDGGVALREEMAPPQIPPRFGQAVVRAFKRHKISRGRALELLRGTISMEDLPMEDNVPVDSMRAQFDLD